MGKALCAALLSVFLSACDFSGDDGAGDSSGFSVVNDYCYADRLDIIYGKSFEGRIQYIVSTADLSIASKDQFDASTSEKTSLSITADDRLYDDYVHLDLDSGTDYHIYILDEGRGTVKTFSRSTSSNDGYTPVTGTISGNTSGYTDYTIYFPNGYDAASGAAWPLLVAIKARAFVDANNHFPCIVFAADVSGSAGNLTRDSNGVRDKLKSIIEDSAYRIDPSRLYIMGFSAGGCAAVMIANDDGSTGYDFKALAADGVSGWVGTAAYGDYCSDLGAVDIWLFAGENDTTYGPQTVEAYNGIASHTPNRTGELLLSTVADTGHNAGPVWRSPVVLKWLVGEPVAAPD